VPRLFVFVPLTKLKISQLTSHDLPYLVSAMFLITDLPRKDSHLTRWWIVRQVARGRKKRLRIFSPVNSFVPLFPPSVTPVSMGAQCCDV
jgi:hypothetical protein